MREEDGLRVLLLYVSDISGHRQAAKAIAQTFKQEHPSVITKEENLFRHGNPFVRCILNSLYYAIIKLTPWFWNIIWDSKEVYWLTHMLRTTLYRMNYHRLHKDVIAPFDPDIIICTHSLSCAICSTIKKVMDLNYLLVAVPTDFYLHPYWFYKNVDMYFLPENNSNLNYLKRKIPSDRMQVTGIPISPEFSESKDKSFLREKWQVEKDLFTILIMGGGQGFGAIEEIVSALQGTNLPVQVLVVTGVNRHLKRNLSRIAGKLDFPFKVMGYVKQIDELMEISDLLITKPGGLTVAEALSKGLPMGVMDSIAGQEMRNKKLLLEKGLAFNLERAENAVPLIQNLLNGNFNREGWRIKTRKIARPDASREIVHYVMQIVKDNGKIKCNT